jgi:transposase-like protein
MGRHYSVGLKERVRERLRLGEGVRGLAREFNLPKSVVYEWKERMQGRPGKKVGEPAGEKRDQEILALEGRIAELEAALGRKGLEVDFFRGALRRLAESGRLANPAGKKSSGPKSAAGWNRKAN